MAEAPHTRNWKARELTNKVGRDGRLTVTGEVMLIGTGTTAKLVLHVPQGINPAILLLDLDITSTGGIQGQIARWVKVSYEQKTSGRQYNEVDIFSGGEIIARIKVDHPLTAKNKPAKKSAKKPAKKSANKKSAKKSAKKPTKKRAKKRAKK
jgi:hypothetical protein